MLEACHHYGALFRKEYADDYHDLDNAEYERVRELIAQAQIAHDNSLAGVASA